MSKRRTTTPDRKLFLDGIRGWASLMVLLWHLVVTSFYPHAAGKAFLEMLIIFSGPFAMCLFFVVSGFALSTAYIKKPDTSRLAQMAAARYFRLVIPILAACFIVYLALVTDLIPSIRPRDLGIYLQFPPSLGSLLQFSLWDVFFDFQFQRAYLLPLWTMQYIMAGSILIFGMLLMFQPIAERMYIYVAMVLTLLFFNSYYCLFVGGLILAELYQRKPQRRDAVTQKWLTFAVLFALFIPALSGRMPGFFMMGGAIAFVAACIWLAPLKNFLENNTSQFLGRISFALFLVHPILLYSYTTRLFYGAQEHGWFESSAALLAAAITLPLAIAVAVMFAPIDRYAHRASHLLGKKVVSGVSAMVYAARQRMRKL